MKTLKKIGALAMVLALVLALGVTAFAADDTYEGSHNYGWGVDTTDPTKIPLTKSIVIFNPDGTKVREPDVSFTYTVTPFDTTKADAASLAPAQVTDDGRYDADNNPVTVTVLNGVANSVTGVTISFANTNEKANSSKTGVELEKTENLSVDLTKFQRAGIYRYKVTEASNPADVTSVGLEARDGYSNTRYLDLYIGNAESPATGFVLKGAVIFKTDAVDDSSTAATNHITTTTDKTTGFEPGTPASSSGTIDYTNDKTVDRYFTYNIEVNKTTTGTLADKSNDFPFEVKLKGNLTHGITVDIENTGSGTVPTTGSISTTELALNPALSNGDKITVTGIPVGTTVTVKETNNTPDQYSASWDSMTGTTTTNAAVKGYTSAGVEKTDLKLDNGEYAINTANVAVDAGQVRGSTIEGTYNKTVLGYTNTLSEISVTGVALRFAPYVLMLGMAAALFVLSRKRKAYEA